jgi:hypothetical protein
MRAQGALLLLTGVLIGGGLGLGGCRGPIGWTRVTVNQPLRPQDVAFIVPRQTTWDEVTARLGAPDQLVRTGDGLALNYVSSDGKSFGVNFGWPLGFITPISYVPHDFRLGGQGVGSRTFQVAFDAHDIVVYARFLPGAPASQYRVWPFGGPGS